MKKIIRILALALAVAIMCVSFGCNKNSGNKFEEDGDGNLIIKEPVVVRFAAPEGKFEAEIEKFTAGFKKIYPEVTIKFEPIAGDWTSQLLMQLGSHSGPDIFWTEEVYSYASRSLLEPLDGYFKKYNVDKNDFYESMLKVGEYNGVLYMMPREYNKVVCYYNKKIMDEVFNSGVYNETTIPFTYDVEKYRSTGKFYPANGWTWSEFTATATALIGKTGGDISRRGADISITWGSSGPTIFEGLGGTIRKGSKNTESIDFNNEKNRTIMSELLGYMDSGAFVNPAKPDVGEFKNGKVGMFFSSRPDASVCQNAFKDDWDVVTFPLLPEKETIVTGCSGYVVNASSKVKEVAMRLLFYMVSNEGQTLFSETGNCVPVLKSMKDSITWRTYPRADLNHDAFLWGEAYDDAPYKFKFDSTLAGGKFETAWSNAINEILKDPTVDLSVSMGKAQTKLAEIFNEYAV